MEVAVEQPGRINQYVRRYWLWLIVGAVIVVVISYGYTVNPRTTRAVLSATLRQSTPLVLGALCGLWGERAGVINIGIEGQMLMAAFTGFLVNVYTSNLLLAVGAALVTGALLGLLLACMSVTLKMDQIIGGTVINILAFGLTGYFYQQGLTTAGKLQPIALGPLADIPLLGEVLFQNPPITYLTLLLVALSHYVLYYTRWGLRTRAVGEHPRAADTVGINVYQVRYINVIAGGALAGLAGAFLTLEAVGSFERMMTNGRGFLALAIMIFGKWTPLGAWAAALFIGLTYALNTQFQFLGWNVPPQFVGLLPYLSTIIVLAGLVGRARPPAADGVPYEKE